MELLDYYSNNPLGVGVVGVQAGVDEKDGSGGENHKYQMSDIFLSDTIPSTIHAKTSTSTPVKPRSRKRNSKHNALTDSEPYAALQDVDDEASIIL